MKLSTLTSQYVAYKQAMGMRFHTEAHTLQSFCRAMGDIAVADIAADRVHAYIAGVGPITRFWHRKYEVLSGFYRFAIARGYAASSPLPKIIPKPPQFVPSSRRRSSSDYSTPAPTVKARAANCSPIVAACSSCCCTERHCALVKRFLSRWPMSICPPACSRFE